MPVITPGGGLGAHIDVKEFLPHVPQSQYSACALSCALYICGGIRGMERGTLSEEREPDGTERIASMELLRLAFPRRVFTLSQTEYVIDRVKWLFDHRDLAVSYTHLDVYKRQVSCRPAIRLRHWCSSYYLRISPLH